jgi:hypothetical protein
VYLSENLFGWGCRLYRSFDFFAEGYDFVWYIQAVQVFIINILGFEVDVQDFVGSGYVSVFIWFAGLLNEWDDHGKLAVNLI